MNSILPLALLFFYCSLSASPLALNFFTHTPPYKTSIFCTLTFNPSIPFLTDTTYPCTTLNTNNSQIEHLPLITLPQNQTILWIRDRHRSFHLLTKLIQQGNSVASLASKSVNTLNAEYLKIKPDILFLPITLKKHILSLIKNHPITKPLTTIFYPTTPSTPNFIIPLSTSTLGAKSSLLPHATSWVYALAYSHSLSSPTETFVLKQLSITPKGRILAKKTSHQPTISPQDHVIAIGSNKEDLHLAMGGLLHELKHQHVQITELYTSSITYKTALATTLNMDAHTIYLFMSQKEHRYVLKQLKGVVLKKIPLLVGYYTTPWKEEWNLYHYHPDHGTHLNGWIGLIKLKQPVNRASLEKMGGNRAESYYVTTHLP